MALPSNYLVFPSDLGSDQQGHFMKILIYPNATGINQAGATEAFNQAAAGNLTEAASTLAGAVTVGSSPNSVESICLFVPGGGTNGPLSWVSAHDYDEVKLAKLGVGMIGAVSKTVETALGGATGAARLAGAGAINPKVDVLYSNSQLRTFQFSYFMSPASAAEFRSMNNIIKKLRMYAAPKLALGGASGQGNLLQSGYWFIPPAEFEISFHQYRDGYFANNIYLPKIGRCVLQRVEVDFAPQGQGEFSTFADGAPTACQLTLQFKEMRIISQEDVYNGY